MLRTIAPRSRIVCWLVLCLAACLPAAPQGIPVHPLTSAAGVRALSPAAASLHLPVQLRGTVLVYQHHAFSDALNRVHDILFVADSSGSVYVDSRQGNLQNLHSGDLVSIQGTSKAGWLYPYVIPDSIQVVGHTSLPPARTVRFRDLRNGALDSQWVQVSGVLRQIRRHGADLLLHLRHAGESLPVEVSGSAAAESKLLGDIGGTLQVQGVVKSRFNARHQWFASLLFSPDLGHITVSAPPSQNVQHWTIQALSATDLATMSGQRISVAGQVTAIEGDVLWVENQEQAGILVHHPAGSTVVPGDQVLVTGYLHPGGDAVSYSSYFEDAMIAREPSSATAPVASPIKAEPVQVRSQPSLDARLIQFQAKLLGEEKAGSFWRLSLQSGGQLYRAVLITQPAAAIPAWKPGSLLRVTGVCRFGPNAETGAPRRWSLVIPSRADVALLAGPRFITWSPSSLLILLIAMVCLLVATWFWAVQRTVARQTGFIRAQLKEKSKALLRVEEVQRHSDLLLESIAEAVCAVDADGRVASLNPGGRRLLECSREDVVGRPLCAVVNHSEEGGPQYSAQNSPLLQPLSDYQRHQGYCEVVSESGRRFPVQFTAAPLLNVEGKPSGAVIALVDLTDQRRVEQMKHDFLSVVSHELRTPLTALHGALGMLNTGRLGTLEDTGRRMLQIAVNNASRLIRLINDILDFERLQAGTVLLNQGQCSGLALARQSVEAMQTEAERAGITLSVSGEAANFTGDPDRVLQVLRELIANAIKFSPRRGIVAVTTAELGNEVRFSVRDRGVGVAADKHDLIFRPYHQGDASDSRSKGGTGLGLAICRMIVEAHGGRLWVESLPDQGSNFIVAMPRQASTQATSIGFDLHGDWPTTQRPN